VVRTSERPRTKKVRYIGCSNWQAWKIAKTLGISEFRNLARFETPADSRRTSYDFPIVDKERPGRSST
jgi:aryl-alcohol dehydrogenase-like predicted oxidoreductase